MADAHEACLKAHANYNRAFAIATDTEQSPDGMLALRQAGRAYAEALTLHTGAAMEWLVYAEGRLRVLDKHVGKQG